MKKIIFLGIILILGFLAYLIFSHNLPIILVKDHFILVKDFLKHKKAFDYLKKNMPSDQNLPPELSNEKEVKNLIIKKLIETALYEKEIKKRNLKTEVDQKINEYLKDLPEYFFVQAEVSYGLQAKDFVNFVIKPYFEYQVLKENGVEVEKILDKKSGIIILPWVNLF